MMDGNHDVSLLLAWKSRCRSVKKMPMQGGKPSVIPCSTTAASSTIHAQPWSWGLAALRSPAPPWDMTASFSSQASLLGKDERLPRNPQPRKGAYGAELMVFPRLGGTAASHTFAADSLDLLLCISPSTSLHSHRGILATDCFRNNCLPLLYFTSL